MITSNQPHLAAKTFHFYIKYHVIFDEDFTTVSTKNKMYVPDNWQELYKDTKRNFLYEEDAEILPDPFKHSMQKQKYHFFAINVDHIYL